MPPADPRERLLEDLRTDAERGLTGGEARRRLAAVGPNRLPEAPRTSELRRLLRQLGSPLVLTLLAAAAVALAVAVLQGGPEQGFLARYGDATAIALIVLLNALLGYAQERRAQAAIDALRRMQAPMARVRRDGAVAVIAADELVPGDLIELEAGDAVPADARLLQAVDLAAEESALTGESTPVGKEATAEVADGAPLAERANAVFLGTAIVRGKGRAVVITTGARTELGRIGEAVSKAGDEATPLERRLAAFGKRVLLACVGVSALLFGWGVLAGMRAWHEILLESVSFAVAAIPEGLPAITTITLALGMQRMARVGAVVRRLPAVETLGAATVICTDKTGTLTQNEMTVRVVYAAGTRYRVTGEGYEPRGALEGGPPGAAAPACVREIAETVALCNSAELTQDQASGRYRIIGDPTEGALLTLAAKLGVRRQDIDLGAIVRELPFDSDRKRMTVVVADAAGREIAHVKGGPEVLLPRCTRIADLDGVRPMTAEDRAGVKAEVDRLSAGALRVLAIARRELGRAPAEGDDPESDLTFLGLVGLMDPPRSSARAAVQACHRAGIRAVMITGDHPLTAVAIARELGLWAEGDEVVSGAELAATSEDDLARKITRVRVFARTTAEQKLRIVRAFKAAGHIVAMTGDGVNDAPALKEAHIGVAMGAGGTDVARQAADMVLTNDDFASIVGAVREGRAIYENLQKVIFFLLSSNAGLAVTVFAVSFSGRWQPLTPLMILWINLVTNGLPALALGVDPPDPAQMERPPRSSRRGLLQTRDYLGIMYVGLLMGAAAAYLYAWPPPFFDLDPDWSRAMAFSLLAVAPLFHAWSSRSPTQSIFTLRPLISQPLLLACVLSFGIQLVAVSFPTLRPVFHTHEMSPSHWIVIAGLAVGIVAAVELAKLIARWIGARRPAGSPG